MSHGAAKRDAHHHTEADVTDLTHAGRDAEAIHDNVAGEINAITAKTTPASGDLFLIEDSAASNAKKKITYSTIPAGTATDAIHGESNHDNSHDTNVNNWPNSDTEAWNHALTVSAGDIIIVEWGFGFDDLTSTTDPQGAVQLDNGTIDFPNTLSEGWVVVDQADGYFWTWQMWFIESTSKATHYGWNRFFTTSADAAPNISGSHTLALTSTYTWADRDVTNDFTGSCTLRGILRAEPDVGTYYEEFVLIRHQAQVT